MVDTTMAPYPYYPAPHVKVEAPDNTAALVAAMASRRDDRPYADPLASVLPLMLMGAFKHDNHGNHHSPTDTLHIGRAAAASEALVTGSLMTAKDVDQNLTSQLQAFQTWAANNAQILAKSICDIQGDIGVSSRDIIAAVKDITPQMYQSFANQAAVLTQEFNNTRDAIHTVDRNVLQTSAANALSACQTQSLVQSTSCDVKTFTGEKFYQLSAQLAECCCENEKLQLQTQNLIDKNTAFLSHQMDKQTCDIKGLIVSDGQMTRDLINRNRQDDLVSQLNDAKSAVRDQKIIDSIRNSSVGPIVR